MFAVFAGLPLLKAGCRAAFLCLLFGGLACAPHSSAAAAGARQKKARSLQKRRQIRRDTKYISKETYAAGGIAALLPGFGAGHAMLGKYKKRGWIFTVSEAAALLLIIGASRFQSSPESPGPNYMAEGAMIIFSASFWGLRIWEAVDVWNLPSNYKVISSVPYISLNQSGASAGAVFSYKF